MSNSPFSDPVQGGLAADLTPGESDLLPETRAALRAHANPNHDSLFIRFELIERVNFAASDDAGKYLEAAEQLVALIRKEVIQ